MVTMEQVRLRSNVPRRPQECLVLPASKDRSSYPVKWSMRSMGGAEGTTLSSSHASTSWPGGRGGSGVVRLRAEACCGTCCGKCCVACCGILCEACCGAYCGAYCRAYCMVCRDVLWHVVEHVVGHYARHVVGNIVGYIVGRGICN